MICWELKTVNKIKQPTKTILKLVASIGRAGILLAHCLSSITHIRKDFGLIVKEIHREGVLSLLIVLMSGLFIGMVIALEGYNILTKFNSEEALGQSVAIALVRELGPVVTALLFAGRAGSALTAEIGHLRSTEQIASMEMIGVDPLRRVIAPRLWAGFISLPILAMLFSLVGIWGALLVGVDWLGIYEGSFWSNMQDAVSFRKDVLSGIFKSVIFGLVVTWIAVYQGYDAIPTSEGISKATTKTVVHSSMAILGLDFLLTASMFGVN